MSVYFRNISMDAWEQNMHYAQRCMLVLTRYGTHGCPDCVWEKTLWTLPHTSRRPPPLPSPFICSFLRSSLSLTRRASGCINYESILCWTLWLQMGL